MADPEVIITPPELGVSSRLLDELRAVIADSKYDHLSVSELVGVLEMIKFETLIKWNQ